MLISKNPLVETIIRQEVSDEIYPMFFSKLLPLTDEEYLETAAFIADLEQFHQQALNLIAALPAGVKESYTRKKEACEKVCLILLEEALRTGQQQILINLALNPGSSDLILQKIAAHAELNVLEVLVDNQVRLVACPDIIKKIEANPLANVFIRQKTKEIREFYIEDKNQYQAADEQKLLAEVEQIIGEEEKTATPEEVKEKVEGIYTRIKNMPVAERVKLALNCSKTERMILIKDSNRIVQLSVLSSPRISDDEILTIVRDRSISGEIIDRISQGREWTKNYQIMLALVQNPKTSVNRALGFLKNLYIRDLKIISTDKNVPGNIRQAAANLIKERERTSR